MPRSSVFVSPDVPLLRKLFSGAARPALHLHSPQLMTSPSAVRASVSWVCLKLDTVLLLLLVTHYRGIWDAWLIAPVAGSWKPDTLGLPGDGHRASWALGHPPACTTWMARTTAGPDAPVPPSEHPPGLQTFRAACSPGLWEPAGSGGPPWEGQRQPLRALHRTACGPRPARRRPCLSSSSAAWGRAHLRGRVGGGGADHGDEGEPVGAGEDLGLEALQDGVHQQDETRPRGRGKQ